MFEQLRRSLNELLERATKPEDRRAVLTRMKSTLVQVQLGVSDLRDGLQLTRRKLEMEQRELDTVRRRKGLATGIKDLETVSIAERFERQHEERVRVLEEKVAIQTRELDLAEGELVEMKAELRQAMAGGPIGAAAPAESIDDPLGDEDSTVGGGRVNEEIDALARERMRADRDADAARRLEELKRKMGK